MRKMPSYIAVIAVVLTLISCKKEFDNPNATEDELLKTPEGIVELVVGMKHRFAVNSNLGNGAVFNSISASALSSFEASQKPGANQDFNQLGSGTTKLASNNQVITDLWGNCMIINRISGLLINNARLVISDTNVQFQVVKYALLYKALAIGTLANFWQEFPVTTGDDQPFVQRKEALIIAIGILDEASKISETSSKFSAKLGPEINLKNTINALSARYFNMLGYYETQYFEKAREKAALVPLNSRSVFIYNQVNPNPVYRYGFTATFGYVVRPSFGLPASLTPATADKRIQFYLTGSPLIGWGFGNADTTSLPVYLPGEMLLVQAEAWARKGDASSLDSAKKYLDAVLTKTSANDVFKLGAALPPYNGPVTKEALLTEIYKNRCIELYMSGLKLEDSRRFERPGPKDPNPERNRTYYPYPFQERYGNSNTPPKDPE